MMEVKEFKAEDLDYLIQHGITDKKLAPLLGQWTGQSLEAGGETYTIWHEDRPILIGGIRQYWFNRGEAWVIFGRTDKKDFIRIHHLVQKFLDRSPIRRIEMVVDFSYFEGHRWARALGFVKEAECMSHYHVDGRHASLYALVKNAS